MLNEIAFLMLTSLLFSIGFSYLGYPVLLGYISAGLFFSYSFFSHASQSLGFQLDFIGHLGMLMLLFTVGLEFDLVEFKKTWKKSLLIVAFQVILSLIFACLLKVFFDFSLHITCLIAFLISLSSTGVVIKLLEEMNEVASYKGNLIISILIMQDLAFVPMMMILKGFTENISIFGVLINLFLAVASLILLIWYLSKDYNKLFNPYKFFNLNDELKTLTAVVFCFALAAFSNFMGLSAAYGSFIGGLILGSFGNKVELVQLVFPLSNILVMIFFISIGFEVDLMFIYTNFLKLVVFSLFLLLVKILINYLSIKLAGFKVKRIFFISLMLSQASEFSFSFVTLFSKYGLLEVHQKQLLNSLVIISLTVGSFLPIILHIIDKKKIK